MEQEQKPFEIRDAEQVAEEIWYVRKYYIEAANAEIRRLQQQLADAPTWGEWQDATEGRIALEGLKTGLYEIEINDGSTEFQFMNLQGALAENGYLTEPFEFGMNDHYVRFRRLKYEPKAAREVEKKYELYLGDGRYESLTATELADDAVCDDDLAELARDLLAAQRELAELKGER